MRTHQQYTHTHTPKSSRKLLIYLWYVMSKVHGSYLMRPQKVRKKAPRSESFYMLLDVGFGCQECFSYKNKNVSIDVLCYKNIIWMRHNKKK